MTNCLGIGGSHQGRRFLVQNLIGRNEIAHELSPGGLKLSKPRPRAGPGSKRIDQIVNLARTQLMRRLIAFWDEIRPPWHPLITSLPHIP